MALDYLQMTRKLSPDEYGVKVSLNGLPITPVSELVYDGVSKHYKAENVLAGITKTLSHNASNGTNHLAAYTPEELIAVKEGNALQLRGGGIIKTTHYPPPYNRDKKYTYENSGILDQVFLAELTIERNSSGNFSISGKVKLRPGQSATFKINPTPALRTGFSGRVSEVLEIRIEPGTLTEVPFSGIILDQNDLGAGSPCTVIIHTGNQLDFTNNYLKSAWFFIED